MDELQWPAAQLLRRFGLSEAWLRELATRTRRVSRRRLVQDPAELFVAEGLDALVAQVNDPPSPSGNGPVRVFVSSPGDLRAERMLVADVCLDLAAVTGRDARALRGGSGTETPGGTTLHSLRNGSGPRR